MVNNIKDKQMSKLVMKNNINSELSITHADNKPAKSIVGSDIAVAVDTINDFPLDASDGDTVIVRDLDRGGTFIYDSSKITEHNGGTNFNGWIRQYDSAVNVKWFIDSNDASDDIGIQKALELGKPVIASNGIYKIASTIIIDRQIIFNGSTSTFVSLINDGSPLFEIHTTSNTPDTEKKFGQLFQVDFGNMIIDGNSNNCIGVQLDYIIGSIFHDIHIKDCNNSALQIGYENPPTDNTVDALRECEFNTISTNRCGNPSLDKATLQWFTCPAEIVNSSMSTDIYFSGLRLIENNWKALVISTHRRTTPSIGAQYGVITTVFEKLQVDTSLGHIANCNVVELSHCGYGIVFKDGFFVGMPTQAAGTWGYSMFKLGNDLTYANLVNGIEFTNNRFQNSGNGNVIQVLRAEGLTLTSNSFGTAESKRGVVIAKVSPPDTLDVYSDNLQTCSVFSSNNTWALTDLFFSNKSLINTYGEYKNIAGIYTGMKTNKVKIDTGVFTTSFTIDLNPYIDALNVDLKFIKLSAYATGGGKKSYGNADMVLVDANSAAGVTSYNIVNTDNTILDLNIDSEYGFGDFHEGLGYTFRIVNNVSATDTSATVLVEFL